MAMDFACGRGQHPRDGLGTFKRGGRRPPRAGVNAARRVWRGRLALAATVVIWSSPPIFQFWLAGPFDAWTQNFYRYAAGVLAMTPFLLVRTGRPRPALARTDWLGCALAAVPNAVHQVAQTLAVVVLWPGVYALLGRMSVIITAVLAVAVFADERWIARSAKFQAGIALGLLGVAGLVWVPGGAPVAGRAAGLWLALAAAAAWALYGILVKKFTARAGPTLGFGVIGLFTTLVLLPFMLVLGDPAAVLRAGAWSNFILFGSGVVSIGLGHWLYYIGIRDLGAAPAQSALLLCPLGTMLLSAGLFGESFRAEQVASGAVLLLGAFLSLTASPPVIEEPA